MAKSVVQTGGSGSSLPAFLGDAQYDGLGNSQRAQDNVLPFLAIIQKGSPQINEQKPEYIADAKVGMLFNTATGELHDARDKSGQPLRVIPFAYQTRMVEWVPRSAGGGFVAQHLEDDPICRTAKPKMVDGKQRGLFLPASGNDLVLTTYTFVMLADNIGIPLVIGAASSALTPMRKWMSLRNSFRNPQTGNSYPAFARTYLLQTTYQENESGDWYNWKVGDGGWVESKEVFEVAAKMALEAAKGEMVVGRPPEGYDNTEDGDDGIDV